MTKDEMIAELRAENARLRSDLALCNATVAAIDTGEPIPRIAGAHQAATKVEREAERIDVESATGWWERNQSRQGGRA